MPDFGITAFISGFVQGFGATFGVGTGSVTVGAGFTSASVGATAAGLAAGSWVAGALISIGVSAVAMKALAPSLDALDNQMSFGIGSMPKKKFVYGKTRVGADVPFITTGEWYHGDFGNFGIEKAGKDYMLHMVCEIAGHPVESIDKVWVKDVELVLKKVVDGVDDSKDLYPDQSSLDRNGVQRWIPDGGDYLNRMMLKFYTGEQTLVDADLFDGCNLPSSNDVWSADHVGRGKTYVYVKMHYDPDQFQGGIPHFSFDVTGKNDIRDPRCDVAFTADHTTDTFTATDHGMMNGDIVQVTTTLSDLPLGLTANTNYYVINKTDDTFQLSATRDGSVRTITDNGTGTHTIDHQGGYRDNTALCLADYLTESRDKGGIGEDWDQINETVLNASATICDEQTEIYDSGFSHERYFIGGSFSTGSKPADILSEFLLSMAGWMERVNGKWHINAGAYTAPAMTITESELIERPLVQINRPYKDIFNSITPQLRSTETEWQPGVAESVEALTAFTVTPDHTTETFTATSHGLSDGDRVKFTAWTGTAVDNDNLPADILEETFYYVVNKTDDTFQVSLTKGGSAATFASNGTGTIVAHFDFYLTIDGERKKHDAVYSLINNQTLARRLSLISLLQTRMEVSAKVKVKIGNKYGAGVGDVCCPFDLTVGDTVRWIDAHKSFWEYTGSAVNAGTGSDGTITSVAHGLENGDPLVITDSDDTGWREAFPVYVINKTTDTFQIATYRGGPALTTDDPYPLQYQTIQGKLFRVRGWEFVTEGGMLWVELNLIETVTDLYNWDPDYEVAPASASSITVRSTLEVETPIGLAATSGTNVLYVRADGTIGTRVKLAWDIANDTYVQYGGYVEIEYRPTPDIQFTTDYVTDDEVFNSTAHGLTQWQQVKLTTSGTLPPELNTTDYYYVHSVPTADTFKLAEYRGATNAIELTGNGTGTHKVDPEEKSWTSAPAVVGGSTEAYLTDVQDGVDYDFRIRFKNGMGNVGEYATVSSHTVVGKTAAPGVPTNVSVSSSGVSGIRFDWTNPSDLDFSHINFYFSKIDNYVDGITVSTDVISTNSAHGLSVDDVVYFCPTDDSSISDFNMSGLVVGTKYYVISTGSTTSFQISETQGGSAYDFDPFFTTGNLFRFTRFDDATYYGSSTTGSVTQTFTTVTPGEKYMAFAKAVDTTGNESDEVFVGYAPTNLSTYPLGSVATSVDPLPTYFSDYSFGFYSDKWDSADSYGYMIWYGTKSGSSTETAYEKNYINNGTGTGNTVCFKRATSAPSVPTGTSYIPAGWSGTPPSGTDRLWIAEGGTLNSPNWYTRVREIETPGGYVPETI